MWTQKLTKIEIAKRQLLHAIELFCARDNLVSAITLAGAADEILGKLLESTGQCNALDNEVKTLSGMFEDFYGRPGDPKDLKTLRDRENEARNHLKHLSQNEIVDLDLEQAAVDLIERAIKNYKGLYLVPLPAFTKFDDSAAAWYSCRTKHIR